VGRHLAERLILVRRAAGQAALVVLALVAVRRTSLR
jgi:hypothetical protein